MVETAAKANNKVDLSEDEKAGHGGLRYGGGGFGGCVGGCGETTRRIIACGKLLRNRIILQNMNK